MFVRKSHGQGLGHPHQEIRSQSPTQILRQFVSVRGQSKPLTSPTDNNFQSVRYFMTLNFIVCPDLLLKFDLNRRGIVDEHGNITELVDHLQRGVGTDWLADLFAKLKRRARIREVPIFRVKAKSVLAGHPRKESTMECFREIGRRCAGYQQEDQQYYISTAEQALSAGRRVLITAKVVG